MAMERGLRGNLERSAMIQGLIEHNCEGLSVARCLSVLAPRSSPACNIQKCTGCCTQLVNRW